MTWSIDVVLAFLERICYIQNFTKRTRSQICVVPFSNLGNWTTFGPLRLRCLYYIWTTLLIIVHTFAVIIISLHIRKYAILLHLVWPNSKKLAFTLFLLYSHKDWTANSSSSPRLPNPRAACGPRGCFEVAHDVISKQIFLIFSIFLIGSNIFAIKTHQNYICCFCYGPTIQKLV